MYVCTYSVKAEKYKVFIQVLLNVFSRTFENVINLHRYSTVVTFTYLCKLIQKKIIRAKKWHRSQVLSRKAFSSLG
jgi:hypothetical protein